MIASHTVLWKNPRAPVTSRTNPLLDWSRFDWWPGVQVFKQTGSPGPLGSLAAAAMDGAVAAVRNVTISQTALNPASASPADLLTDFMRALPLLLICPERPGANNKR